MGRKTAETITVSVRGMRRNLLKGDDSMKISTAFLSAALIVGSTAFMNADDAKKKSLPTEQKEDTTKSTPSGTTKHSIDTVVGKVTDYSEGKSITVETPKGIKKTRSFDLSGNDLTANVAPGIAVGSTVKVVERTNNQGHKTVTVTAWGKGHRARAKRGTSTT